MFKKLVVACIFFIAGTGLAMTQVDANLADGPALGSIKGIGPVMTRHILEEREEGGKFRNWDDFQERVTGVGPKSSVRLSENGLTIDGRGKFDPEPPAAAAASVTGRAPGARKAGIGNGSRPVSPGK